MSPMTQFTCSSQNKSATNIRKMTPPDNSNTDDIAINFILYKVYEGTFLCVKVESCCGKQNAIYSVI